VKITPLSKKIFLASLMAIVACFVHLVYERRLLADELSFVPGFAAWVACIASMMVLLSG
jgi:hypothetical protein